MIFFFIKHYIKEIKNESFMMFTINFRVFILLKTTEAKHAGNAKFTEKEYIESVWRIKEPTYNFISQVDIL